MTRVLVFVLLGCGQLLGCKHHELQAPSDFVVLDEDSAYATRAASAQGVVIGVREIDNDPRANGSFWLSAIRTQLVDGRGYALLETRDVQAKSGQKGKQLRLGRDQNGEQYLYWLTLFVTKHRLYLVEAGARRDSFDKAQKQLDAALTSFSLTGDGY